MTIRDCETAWPAPDQRRLQRGHGGKCAEGLRVLNREKVDLVISDLRWMKWTVCSCLLKFRKSSLEASNYSYRAWFYSRCRCSNTAGVFSFLTKPVDKDALYQAIVMRWSSPRQPPTNAGAKQLSPQPADAAFAGTGAAGGAIRRSVLINGQSGTGKEIFAQAIPTPARAIANHLLLLTVVHCPAIAGVGAVWSCAWRVYWRCHNREGLFQAAEGGTLFLDEIAICPHRCRLNCCACCRSVKCPAGQ